MAMLLGNPMRENLSIKTFKETGTKTGGFENHIGINFNLGQIPFMMQIFGTG